MNATITIPENHYPAPKNTFVPQQYPSADGFVKSLKADSFLEEALSVMKQRAALRDAPGGERSMAKTVAIFNAWTDNNLSIEDGWRFMLALKQAREIQGKFHADDYADGSAYFALLGEERSLCQNV